MKILKKEGVFRKVTNDHIADDLIKNMGWEKSTRSEWKESIKNNKINVK